MHAFGPRPLGSLTQASGPWREDSLGRMMTPYGATFEIYEDAGGKFRWRLIASNGQTVASSGESFDSKASATRAAEAVKETAAEAEVED